MNTPVYDPKIPDSALKQLGPLYPFVYCLFGFLIGVSNRYKRRIYRPSVDLFRIAKCSRRTDNVRTNMVEDNLGTRIAGNDWLDFLGLYFCIKIRRIKPSCANCYRMERRSRSTR